MQNAGMAIQITIRGVSEEVRNELAVRAAERGQSMQEFLRGELERIVSRPTVERWLGEVRRRKEASMKSIESTVILGARDADRK